MIRTATRSYRRLGQILGAVTILAALVVPSPRAVTAIAAGGDAAAPLDLAAMVLTPDDLARAGQDGFGVSFGRTLADGDLADRAVWPTGQGPELDGVRETLLAAGWQQAYAGALTTVRAGDDSGPIRDIEVEVVAYADAAGATAGFGLIPDAYATGEMDQLAGSTTIGDESRITRVAARDPGSGTAYPELALGFRHGRLTARLLIRDLGGAAPAIGEIEILAQALLTRIERVLAEGGPGLSLRALRVEPARAGTFGTDAYLRLVGEDRRSAFETAAAFAERTAVYGDAIDVFTSASEFPAADGSYNLGYSAVLARFATADQAAAWLGATPARLRQQPDQTEFAVEEGMAGLGDEAVVITMTRDSRGSGGDRIHAVIVVVRVGIVVAEVRLERAYDALPPAVALDLAQAQASCLAADACQPRSFTLRGEG